MFSLDRRSPFSQLIGMDDVIKQVYKWLPEVSVLFVKEDFNRIKFSDYVLAGFISFESPPFYPTSWLCLGTDITRTSWTPSRDHSVLQLFYYVLHSD